MNKRPAWWLLPNLLSLDAPIVALAWMWVLAKSMRVIYVESSSYWLVAAAVWCIYVLDRIFDVWRVKRAEAKGKATPSIILSPRHHFHWKCRFLLLPLVVGVIGYSGYAALNIASENLLTAGFSGMVMILAYLLICKLDQGEITYLKNFTAGMIFAFGVSAPIVLERIDLYSSQSVMSLSGVYYHFTDASTKPIIEAIVLALINTFKMTVSSLGVVMFHTLLPLLFGCLCFLNITAIDLWQRSRSTESEDEKHQCEAIVGTGLMVLVALSVYLAAFRFFESERIFAYAIMIAAALLQFLNKKRSMFYLDAQRVLADFMMILPLPLVWMLAEESAF